MIIDIFGDSFSDTSIKQQDTDTWTDILRNKYKFNLRNYSKHGTGSQWSIEQFLKLETHGDYLLFCLADMNRVAFEYIKDEEQAHALLLYNMLNDNNHDFPDTINKDVIKNSKKIFNDYESFYSTGLNRLLEVLFVSFIFSKSKHYRKILIWPSSGLGYPFRFYNDRIEIPDNGYIMHKSIHLISTRELQIEEPEKGNTFTFGKDKRNNHMSYENHIIFAKQVNDFFINDTIPDYSRFKCGHLK